MLRALPKLPATRLSTVLLTKAFSSSPESKSLIKRESIVDQEETKKLEELRSLTEQLKISTMKYTTLFQNKIETEKRGVLYMSELAELDLQKSRCERLEKEVTSLHYDIFKKKP